MKHIYRKTYKISYNNSLFQVLVRNDKSVGFLKVNVDSNGIEKYSLPSAQEFLHLSSVVNVNNAIKF
jgi:hypothetical protein